MTRRSQPNLHIAPVKKPPESQSSIESQDSVTTYEGTRSTRTSCPPSYSPASQRSRYSQPNLPYLMIPYDHHRTSLSPDRRIRMSQPTLTSSFSGTSFPGIKGSSKFSYSSLRTSGDNSIHQIQDERRSTPNVFALENNRYPGTHRGSRLSQPDIRRILRSSENAGKRERLSQPTLVTGDYYPQRIQHQRLSQPCLLNTWNEKPISLHSPMKHKRLAPTVKQRDRLSQLDFGSARFKYNKEFKVSTKFNRDRFSIPEVETQNDLRQIVGTPKQRFSLDSQLNTDGNRGRRLLPIASSPISEIQAGVIANKESGKGEAQFIPTDGLENVIVATASPLMPPQERQFLAPILKIPPTLPLPARERMSVPEIRNSSLRRLLDPPVKQRHSITGSFRQSSLVRQESTAEVDEKLLEICDDKVIKIDIERTNDKDNLVVGGVGFMEQIEEKVEPKHIQRHYAYTYDTKDEPNEVIGRLSVSMPRKKYLESNFDENEQVITTVIETEIPMILSSPKYMKKTHVYGSEAPKWMKKCLESPSKKQDHDQVSKINMKNKKMSEKSPDKGKKKASPKKTAVDRCSLKSDKSSDAIKVDNIKVTVSDECIAKETCVRIKSSDKNGVNKYEVAINSDLETDLCRIYGIDCDTESEDSTSV